MCFAGYVSALRKACDAYTASGAFTVRKKTRVTGVLMDDVTGAVRGVRWAPLAGMAWRILLATSWDAILLSKREFPMRVNIVAGNAPGSYCLPRHRISFNTTNEGTKCV